MTMFACDMSGADIKVRRDILIKKQTPLKYIIAYASFIIYFISLLVTT